MRRPKSVALAFLSGAVLVGALLGFTADRVVLRDQICERRWDQRSMRARLAQDLSLSASQRATVDSILDERNARIRGILEPVRPQMDSVSEAARNEIRRLLSPEQRTRYEELLNSSHNSGNAKRSESK